MNITHDDSAGVEDVRPQVQRSRIDPCTCDIKYSSDEIEFMMAMQRYKEENRRPFPTWKEVLEVVLKLGYVKQ